MAGGRPSIGCTRGKELLETSPGKKEGNAAGFFRHQAAVENWHPLINSHTCGRPLLFLLVTGASIWQTPARDV
jgi:hypothetical protein